jgi:hypothetical protein
VYSLIVDRELLGKNLPIVARQRLGKNITEATNTLKNRRIVMRPVSYQVKYTISSSQNFLLLYPMPALSYRYPSHLTFKSLMNIIIKYVHKITMWFSSVNNCNNNLVYCQESECNAIQKGTCGHSLCFSEAKRQGPPWVALYSHYMYLSSWLFFTSWIPNVLKYEVI